MRLFLLLLCCAGLIGCGSSEPEPDMRNAFEGAPPSPAKNLADEAMAAYERKDYPKAVVNLETLRQDQSLSTDQILSVQEMMAKVQMELAARAEAGDAQAQQTLRLLQSMPRR